MPSPRNKIFLRLLLCLFMTVAGQQARAGDAAAMHHEREAYAREFAQDVINILHDHKKAYDDRKDILRRAFAESVDIDWIAKFALGYAWRNASDDQRRQYLSLYRKFLTETYVSSFAENPGKSIYTITILGVGDDEADGFTVRTRMELMNRQILQVSYRVHDENSHYLVRDIVIENVSLAATHRAEFSGLASAQGVDGLLKTLQTRIEGYKEASLP